MGKRQSFSSMTPLWHHPYGRKWRGTKEPLDEGEREEWKAGLKWTFKERRSWHLLPSLHANRWGNNGTVRDFTFLGFKITTDDDCSHEIKRCLLLARKAMTNLNSELESRDIALPTKVHLVKAMVFPVVMYGCESWTIKKAEHWRTDAFELWCWRRFFFFFGEDSWESLGMQGDPILKDISPEYSLEGLMLKLKL